jgi:hypothetical protein
VRSPEGVIDAANTERRTCDAAAVGADDCLAVHPVTSAMTIVTTIDAMYPTVFTLRMGLPGF